MAGYFDDLIPAGAAPAAAPAAPAPGAPVYGSGSAFSGQAATPAQQAYATAAGAPSGPVGSGTNPSYDTPDLTGTGDISHVDLGGNLHTPQSPDQAVSIPSGAFDDLVPARMRGDYWGGIRGAVSDSASRLMDDLREGAELPRPSGDLGKEAAQAWRQFTLLPRTIADAAMVPGSAIDAATIQPAASALDRIPLDAYAAPEMSIDGSGVHIKPPQKMTGAQKHDANADMLRLPLAGYAANPEEIGARLGSLSGAQTAADLARAPPPAAAPEAVAAEAPAPPAPAPQAPAAAAPAARPAPPFNPAVEPDFNVDAGQVHVRPPQVGEAPAGEAAPNAVPPAAAPEQPAPPQPAPAQPAASAPPGPAPDVHISQSYTPAPDAAVSSASPGAVQLSPLEHKVLQFIADRLPPGVTPETLMAANPQLTAAEAAGQMMGERLDTWAKQPGVTGEGLADLAELRRNSRPGAILSAAADALGIHPNDASALRDMLLAQGREEAEPAYEWANSAENPYSRNGWNPTFENLATRPAIKQAMKTARDILQNEGHSPEILGADFLENPEQWATYEPPPFTEPTASNPVGFAGRAAGPARAPSRGPSLVKFIADNGGIADGTGDVTAMGGDQWHVGKPFQRQLIGGQQPDDVATRAWEAGYFPGRDDPPTTNELYDAIGDELRGRALYSRDADQAAQQRFERANAAEERAYYGGDAGELPTPDGYGARPEPQTEPVQQNVPTIRMWDAVKRALDTRLKPYTSGKLEWDDEARSVEAVRKQLVEALGQASPDWRAAANIGQGYLAPEDAARFGQNSFFTARTTPKQVAEMLQGAPPSVRNGMTLGVAEKIRATIGDRNGVNQMLSLLGPTAADNRAKLGVLLGDRRAQRLLDEIDLQKSMRDFESGLKNSKTAGRIALMDEQQAPGHVQGTIDAAKNALKLGPEKAFWAGVHATLERNLDRLATPTIGQAERDVGGPMLFGSPQELARMLKAYQEQKPQAFGPAVPYMVRKGMIGSSAPQ